MLKMIKYMPMMMMSRPKQARLKQLLLRARKNRQEMTTIKKKSIQ